MWCVDCLFIFFFQAEDGIRDGTVTGVQTCALPILVVPSPALSLVLLATSRTICAPMFSYGSSSSISFATVTPSLVTVGEPNFLSRTTLRPLGPSVALTAFESFSTPLSNDCRAFSSNINVLAAIDLFECFWLSVQTVTQSRRECRPS